MIRSLKEALTMKPRFLIAATLAALLAGCASKPAPAPAPRAPLKLTVLHTNDHHGRFWTNSDGEYGLAARKTLIDKIRAEVAAAGGQVLLLDGGDINTGVPESDLQDAEPDFKGMNLLGYDAAAIGNHEFDKPLIVLDKQIKWSKFPLLAANIYNKTSGQRMFEPYRVFERGGYKIAVLGLTTDDTSKMVMQSNIVNVEFRKPADEAAKLVPQLRSQADMVIAATHMGHYTDGKSGVNAPGDVEMARAVKGLDLIVGGHSQNPVCMSAENKRNDAYKPGEPCAPDRQNGAWIVQAHEWGKYVGRADFVITAPGKVELVKYQLLPVNLKQRASGQPPNLYGEAIAEDAAVREFLKPFQDNGQARLSVPVGETVGAFDGERTRVRAQPTNLGYMIARSMMERTGADLAIMNAGGIRDSLPAGKISYRDVLKVQPFANQVSLVRLTGAELLKYLEAVAKMTPGSGAFPQTAGVQMLIEGGALKEAKVGGQPIDARREYRLTLLNFTAGGGDGYPKLNNHPGYVDTGFTDADVMRAFIAAGSPLKAADFTPPNDVVRK
jgi:5'-nucleotidase/UDP-sugar diphosphatase